MRIGVSILIRNTSSLFYIVTDEELEDLLQQVFHGQHQADMILCELCSLAGLGCQYLPDLPPLSLRESLFHTATRQLNECIQTDIVRAIHVMACLSIYSIMQHRNIARASIRIGVPTRMAFAICADMDQIPD